MSQTKKGSFIESIANIIIGFGINYGVNLAVLPIMWDPNNAASSAFHIGLVFTVISVIRSFILRRVFNKIKTRWNVAEDPFAVHKAALNQSRGET